MIKLLCIGEKEKVLMLKLLNIPNSKNRIINSGNITTFQEYSVVSENRLSKANNLKEIKIGPLLGCAVPTAWGILAKETQFKKT